MMRAAPSDFVNASGDGREARERAAVQHALGEFDVEMLLDRQHELHRRERGETGGVEVLIGFRPAAGTGMRPCSSTSSRLASIMETSACGSRRDAPWALAELSGAEVKHH
jgi:hypothetical protein